MGFAAQRPMLYPHEWYPDELLIWDNADTLCRAVPFDVECGRRLHCVTLGEESLTAE